MINTNARSIKPKMNCFVDNFKELDLTFAVITETWLTDGDVLSMQVENLLLGSGLSLFTRNRPPNIAGFSHGGIAIVTRESCSKFKVFDFPNPDGYEVMAVSGSVLKLSRKVFIIACYMPPNYRVPRAKGCFEHVNNLILEIKATEANALICLAGDFNQWEIEKPLEDFPDLGEVLTGPTRNNRRIDRTFTNWNEGIRSFCCLKPLEADLPGEDGVVPTSDHLVQLVEATFPRKHPIKWEKFTYRPYKEDSAGAFASALRDQDWSTVVSADGSNSKARAFQMIIDDHMDHFFPLKTVKRKSDDLPWLNNTARKMIRRKKAIFKSESRSTRWRRARYDVERYLEKRRLIFLEGQRKKFTGPEACRNFFRNVKSFNCPEKPKVFDIRDLEPGKSEPEVAEGVAEFFNKISHEFKPLQPQHIPSTYDRPLPYLSIEIVAKRLRECKKPKSMVHGDIFPKLVNRCADFLAVPLSCIYNEILRTYVWPIDWKVEYVTPIPKKKLPDSYSDLRNISCTKLFSKVFESFVLQFASEEVSLKNNQYGGVKGCSTAHMIVELVQEICHNAEDYRSATVILALDYAKAFNRMSFQHCLLALQKKGASNGIIRLISTFLTNRTLTVRVGTTWSKKRDVCGGCPQGSILGVFLFNLTTDDLEDDFLRFEHERLGLIERGEEPAMGNQETGENDPGVEPHHEASFSTPTKDSVPLSLGLSPIRVGVYHHAGRDLTFIRGTINSPLELPPEEAKHGTQVLKPKPVKICKYIDDCISCEKLNFGQVDIEVVDGKPIKRRRAVGIQNSFVSITGNAKKKGMKINTDKTGLICISDALHYRPETYFAAGAELIESKSSLKVLGYHFSSKPDARAQADSVKKKIRQRYWSLTHLSDLGFSKPELVQVYKSSILPLADYCDVAYHSQLTDEQDEAIERLQSTALKRIFGYKNSAKELRSLADLKTLRERRIEHCDKFASKCAASTRFASWFPMKTGRRSVRPGADKYIEEHARCDRLKNSPIYFMRRRMNNKPGKEYGQRNKEYREDLRTD